MMEGAPWRRSRSWTQSTKIDAATQLGTIAPAAAQRVEATMPVLKPGTHTSFGPLQQIEAGVLTVGYAEAGPRRRPHVCTVSDGVSGRHVHGRVRLLCRVAEVALPAASAPCITHPPPGGERFFIHRRSKLRRVVRWSRPNLALVGDSPAGAGAAPPRVGVESRRSTGTAVNAVCSPVGG
jgi:hypothetical protein